jgi:hypothetical protein
MLRLRNHALKNFTGLIGSRFLMLSMGPRLRGDDGR